MKSNVLAVLVLFAVVLSIGVPSQRSDSGRDRSGDPERTGLAGNPTKRKRLLRERSESGGLHGRGCVGL